ncbi:MAG: SRPBCC family protein, partial [Gemmatimonadaceae bacterium]
MGVEVRRTIHAARACVFAAWTDPAAIRLWNARGGLRVPVAEVELRVGGAYRIDMTAPDGTVHRISGEYLEIDQPKRLVYTWHAAGDPASSSSIVTVEFIERGASTEIRLRHDRLDGEDREARHQRG